jgi:hypothetical protein
VITGRRPKEPRSTLKASACVIWRLRGRALSSRASRWPPEQLGSIVPGGIAPAEPSLAGFAVRVADLDRVRGLLARNGVPVQAAGGRLVVAAADACGSAVLFEA